MIHYEEVLFDIINKLNSNYHILVKEHPGVYGFRKPGFYKRLLKHKNVTLCATSSPSQECIDISSAVLIWTGSVGFEAALRGKAVLTLAEPYYQSESRFFRINSKTELSEIDLFINSCNTPPNREYQRSMVTFLLSGMLPGVFKNDGSFDSKNERDVNEARAIGNDLANLYLSK